MIPCTLRIAAASGLLLASLCAGAQTTASSQRPLHRAERYARVEATDGAARIVVKFLDGSGVRASANKFAFDPALIDKQRFSMSGKSVLQQIAQANALIQKADVAAMPLIRDSESELAWLHRRAERYWRHQVAELGTYSQLPLPGAGRRTDPAELIGALNAIKVVEVAYLEPMARPPAKPNPDAIPAPAPQSCAAVPAPNLLGDLIAFQGYLGAPPQGTHALALHPIAGGRGQDVRVIDIEGGASRHADLPAFFLETGETYTAYADHGEKVIGVLAAGADGIGTTGMAPDASIGLRSIFNSNVYEDWNAATCLRARMASPAI